MNRAACAGACISCRVRGYRVSVPCSRPSQTSSASKRDHQPLPAKQGIGRARHTLYHCCRQPAAGQHARRFVLYGHRKGARVCRHTFPPLHFFLRRGSARRNQTVKRIDFTRDNFYSNTIAKLADTIVVLDDEYGAASRTLLYALREEALQKDTTS